MRQRSVIWILALWTCLAVSGRVAADAPGAPVQGTTRVEVTFMGCRNDTGMVLAEIFNRADGFPQRSERAVFRTASAIHNGVARVVFDNLPPGDYAVVGFHDENGNLKLDKNWMGIPIEGIAVSNNAPHEMGPPKFEEARFAVPPTGRSFSLPMQYHE